MFLVSNSNPMYGVKDGAAHWPVLKRGIETSSEDVRAAGAGKLLRDFFGGDVRKSVTPQVYRESNFSGQLAKTSRVEQGRCMRPASTPLIVRSPVCWTSMSWMRGWSWEFKERS